MSIADQFKQMQESQTQHSVEELTALFENLPAVEADFMLGEWRGGVFQSGHPGERQLQKLQWRGKRFTSADEVYPILVQSEKGQVVVSDIMGQASLREVVYKGSPTATMVYDNHPTFDYFHRVNITTVMGLMEHKPDAQPLFFYLYKVSDADK